MSPIPPYECTLIDRRTREPLGEVPLPLVPQVGEELHLVDRSGTTNGGVYRVVGVRYDVEDRQRLRLGHLAGITVLIEPAV